MPAFINTNIASLNAQRNLNTSQSQLTTSLQRLSSGLRINSAKDDAAGLAIANRFTTQINGQDQASRNANDAISLAQTAEGALGEMTNNLQRIRELSVQAANSTNSDSDRAAINQEVQQRLAEIDRTASTTNFNGQKILDGSFGSANFQIGANVGESINVNLSTSMRNTATGKIATATAGTLGASAGSNGTVKSTLSTTAADLNFSAVGSADTAGSVSFTATSFDFSAGLVAGTSSAQSVTAGDFSQAGVAQVDSSATTAAAVTLKDYSGGGLAQFDVNIAGSTTATVGITLSKDYTTGGLTTADMAKDIQDQIRATAGNENVSVSIDSSNKLKISNTGKMGAGNAVTITNDDANASEFAAAVSDNGTGATPTGNLSMKVDGTTITLSGDHSGDGLAGVASELTQKMKASGLTGASDYSAAVSGGKIVITHANSANAVAISGTDANAQAAGFADTAGVAGSGSATSKAASLQIDGHNVSLNSNYGSYAGLAGALQTQLGGSYDVSSTSGGDITIKRTTTGASSTAIDITNGDSNTSTLGITGGAKTGTAGAYSTAGGAADFYVDGKKVTLTGDYSQGMAAADATQTAADMAQMATDITSQLSAAGSSVTASFTGGKLVFDSGSAAAVNITGADAKATKAGIAFASGTAGSATGSLSLQNFSINGIELGGGSGPAKAYASTSALADAINNNVAGVYASVDKTTNALTLSSSSDIKLAGADATGATGFNATTAVADKGDLSKIDVSTAAGALTAIQRTDSALTNVSSLRSTFGAMQNRFESVISNLASATENLSAARSRLQDTDFASETAKMTRGQILQQAGTAMLAQANSLPNGVLSLLR